MDQLISYKEHLFINNVILNIFTVTRFQAIILILLHLIKQKLNPYQMKTVILETLTPNGIYRKNTAKMSAHYL